MKTAPHANLPVERGSPPDFCNDRSVMLQWLEPKAFVRLRWQRQFDRLTRRERFLFTYFLLFGFWICATVRIAFPYPDPGPSPLSLMVVGGLSPWLLKFFIFRAPLRWPVSTITLRQNGLVQQALAGAKGWPYRRFAGFRFVEQDGCTLVSLRYAHARLEPVRFFGITLKPQVSADFALPDASWRSAVQQALNHAGVPGPQD